MATTMEFFSEVGVIALKGENVDGCVCLYQEIGKDGQCLNVGHPICEKCNIGLKRALYIIRKTPGHA